MLPVMLCLYIWFFLHMYLHLMPLYAKDTFCLPGSHDTTVASCKLRILGGSALHDAVGHPCHM